MANIIFCYLTTKAGAFLLVITLLVGFACQRQTDATPVTKSSTTAIVKASESADSEALYLPLVQTPIEIPVGLGQLAISYPRNVIVNPNNDLVYVVAGFGGNTVVVLDGLEVLAEHIIAGATVDDIELDLQNNRVFILHDYPDSITMLQNEELIYSHVMPMNWRHRDSMWHEQEQLLYIAGLDRRTETTPIKRSISIFDGQEQVAKIDTGNFQASYLAADPTSGYVYAGGKYIEWIDDHPRTVAGVLVFDNQTLIAKHRIEKSSQVHELIAHPNGDVFARTSSIGDFNVADLHLLRDSELITSTLVFGTSYQNQATGMVSNPRTGDLYLHNAGEVAHIRFQDGQFINLGKVTIGCCITKSAVNERNNNVYIINFRGDKVVILNGIEPIANFSTFAPFYLDVNPSTGIAYISAGEDSKLSLFGSSSAKKKFK